MLLFANLPPEQNGRHFADNTFKCLFMDEALNILIQISLKFIPRGPLEKKPDLVQVLS